MTHKFSIAIIGGGVLGLAVVYFLLKQGKIEIVKNIRIEKD